MHTIIRRTVLAGVVAVLALPACSSGSGPTAPDDYLPVISNIWRNSATATYTLLLASGDDRKASGAFTGTENHPTLGTSAVSGTFRNSQATFLIKRSGGDVTYAGTFYGADSLRLVRGSETLRFRIQP